MSMIIEPTYLLGWHYGKGLIYLGQYFNQNQPTAVSDHFSLPGHSINNIELIPLELIKSNRDGIRKARELLFISKGKTLEPHGINRRDET